MFVDLTGKRFGGILVISLYGLNKHSQRTWNCRCDCGNEKIIVGASLRSGATKSCGCKAPELVSAARTKHGQSSTRDYGLWATMIQRCHDEKCDSYRYYGAKGIKVCDKWRNYENFAHDMLPRPFPSASIDRIDNSLGYSKENCRWATSKAQARNTTSNLMVQIDGKSRPLVDWCEEFNIPYERVRQRIKKLGWLPLDALTKPLRGDRRGARVYGSKLIESQIIEMRHERTTKLTSFRKLAAKYGISDATARAIILRKTWPHIL